MVMSQAFSRQLRMAAICLIPCLLLATRANAQSILATVADFGLIGTWAVECDQNPSSKNEHAVFSVTSVGTIELLNDFGPEYDDMVYRIIDAKRVGPDRISLRQELITANRVVLDIVMMKEKDRIRVWSSRTSDGTTLVRDGKIARAGGQATQWVVRCLGRWADNLRGQPEIPPR
jgi:hypothetical protein